MKLHKQRHGATILQSIHTAQVSSVPKTQKSAYLDLYVLGRERTRLMQEMLALDTKRETVNRHLGSINKQMSILQQEMVREQQAASGIKTPSQSVKTVDINY